MVTLLQKSLSDLNSFVVVDGDIAGRATHFIGNDGALKTIDHLVRNVPAGHSDVEPYIKPVMNFGGEDEKQVTANEQSDGSGVRPLVLPTLNDMLQKKTSKKKDKASSVANSYEVKPYIRPSMTFSR